MLTYGFESDFIIQNKLAFKSILLFNLSIIDNPHWLKQKERAKRSEVIVTEFNSSGDKETYFMDNLIYGKVILEKFKKEYKLGNYRWKD